MMNSRRRGPAPGVESLEVRALLSGQAVQLIKDVNTVESFPADLTPAGSNLFYLVKDSSDTGFDLMVTNAGGTQILGDSGGSSPTLSSEPYSLTAVGNDLYFLTNGSGSNAESLGMSDGAVGGTAQVSLPSSVASIPSLTALGNTLLFQTETYSGGDDYQLWAIGQPGASPAMIHDFGSSSITALSGIGGTEYLSVGGNLWTTDGTGPNTQEVEDSSGDAIAAPESVFAFKGQTDYYDSSSGTTIGILGRSGETPEVTLPASATSPVVVGSELYFTASSASSTTNSQLWSSDGTQANTQMVEDFGTVPTVSSTASPSNLTDADGSLFFTVPGTDGLNQLWTSNGTGQGTVLVKDLGTNAGVYTGYGSGYEYGSSDNSLGLLAPVGTNLFFMAYDSTNGAELWSDDVATGTTQQVKDIAPGSASSDPHDFVAFNNQLDFAANDGATPLVNELWRSDGSTAGTELVASFTPGIDQGSATSSSGSSSTTDFATLGSDLLLPLDDGIHGTALWETDGTAAGTTVLSEVDPQSFATLNGTAYFLGTDQASTLGLWETNGTAVGTSEVKDFSAFGSAGGYYGNSSSGLVASGNELYFTTSDGNSGVDLWASNGTANGTSLVKDFTGGSSDANQPAVSDMTAFGGKLAFIAQDGTDGTQVWITDGTSASTVMLTDLSDATGTSGVAVTGPSSLIVVGGQLDFLAGTPGSSSSTVEGLWASNGTPNGTTEFDDALPTKSVTYQEPGSPAPTTETVTPTVSNLTAIGANLYFSLDYSYDNGEGQVTEAQLWSSGGTLGSTAQVPAPAAGSPFTSLSDFQALGSLLLFQADESSGSQELWKSNGTEVGTSLLKVIDPSGAQYGYDNNYYSTNAVVDNGVLYFAADDGTHGQELWQSDGTSAGSYMVDDIDPGAASSNPVPLSVVNGQVVLEADDGTHGDELMEVVSTSQTAPPQLGAIPAQEVTVGGTFQMNVSAYAADPNNPTLPLTYSLGSGSPAGATIDPTTGLVTWATAGQQTGPYSFAVQVADNSTPPLTASETFTVNVNPVAPPALNTIPTDSITVGETFTLDVSQYASDLNTPPLPLTYSLTGNVPSGASIDPTTGTLTWATSSNLTTGPYSFTVEVSDNSSPALTASQTFTVNVDPVESPFLETIPSQGVQIGQTLTLDISQYAVDPNEPPLPLTYSLIGNVPSGVSIDPTSGVLTWSPGSGQATGNIAIEVRISDDSSPPRTASETFTVEVNPVAPPILEPIPTQGVAIGNTLSLDISQYAFDPNGPPLPLTYSLGNGAPAGASIGPTTGLFTWAPGSDQATGNVSIQVIVSDNSTPPLTATESFTVVVGAAGASLPPVLAPIPTESVTVGETLTLNLSPYASDLNNPPLPLTYSLTGTVPAGASVDPTSGVLTWTPASNQAIGLTTLTLIVSDNNAPPLTASESFTVNVEPVEPPVIETLPTEEVDVGQTLTFSIANYVFDPNSPPLPLTYSLGSNPPAGASIDPSSGVLTWTPGGDQPIGNATIPIVVSDNSSPPRTASQTLTVDVSSAATVLAPVISPLPTFDVNMGQTFKVNLGQYVTDPNSPPLPLTYSLGSNVPTGTSLNPTTGALTWIPPSGEAAGPYSIPFTASDNSSPPNTVSGTLTVDILQPSNVKPPVVGAISEQNATIGQPFTINLGSYASDPNDPPLPLTYTLTGNVPSGAGIDPTSGVLTWTPAADQPAGPTTISFQVADNSTPPNTASATFTVDVSTATTSPASPTITWASPSNIVYGTALGATQLDATATANGITVPGTFTYTPALGTVLSAGTDQTLSVKFTPNDTTDYSSASATAKINVAPASPTITWAKPASIAYGTALSATQLDATATATVNGSTVSVPGTFTYTPGLGTVLAAGSNQTLSVEFTPSDATDYTTAGATATIDVSPPPVVNLVLSSIPAQSVNVGQALELNVSRFASETNAPALSLTYGLGSGAPSGASINPTTGVLSWSPGTNQKIGSYPITVQVSDNGSPPRTASETVSVNVVDPRPVTISVASVTTKKGFSITLTFSGPVNPATANNPANYILTEPAKKPKSKHKPAPPPTRISLGVSSYNPATNQVTLKGPKKVKTSPALTLTVVGSGPDGIAKLDGLQLAGSGRQPGTNYVASVTGKTVTPTSAVVGNMIVVRTAARSEGGRALTDRFVRPMIVRHNSASPHPAKIGSTGPAGPMALARTTAVRDVVLGVIPPLSSSGSRGAPWAVGERVFARRAGGGLE
jgi:ELWxxDGT repeat protein